MEPNHQQYADEYHIHMLLGEGGQANVYLGSKENQLYALKIYLPGASKEAAYKIQADFLAKLNYPHLINMVDHRPLAKFKLENRPEEKRPLIVLELAEGGELFEFISKLKNFSPQVTRTYLKQILSALKYLNDIGVTHRDLKPENILFDRNFKLKISDFGLSRDTKGEKGDGRLYSRVGTQGYKPPEMEQGNYEGIQADIFAAGVVLFIMYNGTPPFLSTKTHDRIYKLIRDKNFQRFWTMHERNKPKGFFPDSFKRLINSFFSAEADRRPTFESLESDEWLNGDELMDNELRQYMGAKAAKLAETDPNKVKMVELSKKLCADKLMEEECYEGSRAAVEDPSSLSKQELFAYNYRGLKVSSEELPEYTLRGTAYATKNAAFVVAWLQSYLNEQCKAKNAFMADFIEDIAPVNYQLALGEKGQLLAKLEFEIEEEDQVQLQLKGQLHRNSKGEVGVEWTESSGNAYWVNNVMVGLNGALSELQ